MFNFADTQNKSTHAHLAAWWLQCVARKTAAQSNNTEYMKVPLNILIAYVKVP